MISVYIHGCNCGATGSQVRKVKRYCQDNNIDFELRNSKYDTTYRSQHRALLNELGNRSDRYTAIVRNGDNIQELKSWKPL